VPAVVTVHDLSFLRMPEAFPRLQARYLALATRVSARRAAVLVAVSEFTRREVVRLLGVPPERVVAIPNGCDPRCRPLPPEDVAALRARLELPERFVLAVGTLQPRKNLAVLLRAFAGLRRGWRAEDGVAPDLVVAGAPGWGGVDVRTHADALGLSECLHLPGFVPQEDLPALYNAALCLAMPSRYEGFGLPALEAMACGTAVIVADASSLPEVVGDVGLRVGPDDAAGWTAALRRLSTDEDARRQVAARGPGRAAAFTWRRAAGRLVDVWRDVLGAPRAVARAASSAR
jgi:glycosyltransferase involved in cell wall biosynthesis